LRAQSQADIIACVKRLFVFALAGLSLAGWSAACGTEDTTFCTPGAKQTCICDTGKYGSQTCLDDGSAFGECQCGDGMGAGSGGGGGSGGAPAATATASSAVASSSASSSVASSTVASSTSTGGGCFAASCKDCTSSECAKLACTTEVLACDNDPDCVGYEACLKSCSSSTCITQCKTKYPNGPKLYSAKSTCVYCSPDACKDLCDVNNTCK